MLAPCDCSKWGVGSSGRRGIHQGVAGHARVAAQAGRGAGGALCFAPLCAQPRYASSSSQFIVASCSCTAVQLSTCRCGTATAIRERPRARQLCPVAVTIAHFKLRAARKLTPHCAVVHLAGSSQFQHSPFIRACYPRLFEMLMRPWQKDVMLIGTPGVGKVGLSAWHVGLTCHSHVYGQSTNLYLLCVLCVAAHTCCAMDSRASPCTWSGGCNSRRTPPRLSGRLPSGPLAGAQSAALRCKSGLS